MKRHNNFLAFKFFTCSLFALCILIATSLWILSLISNSNKYQFNKKSEYVWENAYDAVPQSLLAQVKSSLPETKLKKKSIKVLKISLDSAGELFVFDYRSPELCGVGGCLYEVYRSEGERLLQIIANPNLPPSQQLIKVDDTIFKPFPCLKITQNTTYKRMVSENEYCFDTGKYRHFHESWTPIEKN
ncbi:MAG: histidine kinase [Rivularia sp. (in: cyanobacteria)]